MARRTVSSLRRRASDPLGAAVKDSFGAIIDRGPIAMFGGRLAIDFCVAAVVGVGGWVSAVTGLSQTSVSTQVQGCPQSSLRKIKSRGRLPFF